MSAGSVACGSGRKADCIYKESKDGFTG